MWCFELAADPFLATGQPRALATHQSPLSLRYGPFFPTIPKIHYKGPQSTNPLAFRFYNANEVVLGKPMGEWLRFSVAFWHTFGDAGADAFGKPTKASLWLFNGSFHPFLVINADLNWKLSGELIGALSISSRLGGFCARFEAERLLVMY